MADAAEEAAGLPDGAIRLKWPNDLVVEAGGETTVRLDDLDAGAAAEALAGSRTVLKLGGVLGESEGLGTADPRVIVGIGVNADWRPADFPPELADTMTSLFEASRGRPTDLPTLLDGFLGRLEVRIAALRAGRFDLADWNTRQVTTGREIDIDWPDGSRSTHRALGVDAASGGLVVAEEGDGERILVVGEVRHVRISGAHGVVGVTP
jgi:biotin-(acetyl-CoA carboxylase) ligase